MALHRGAPAICCFVLAPFMLFPGGSPGAVARPRRSALARDLYSGRAGCGGASPRSFRGVVDLNSIGRGSNAHGVAGARWACRVLVSALPPAAASPHRGSGSHRPQLAPLFLLAWLARRRRRQSPAHCGRVVRAAGPPRGRTRASVQDAERRILNAKCKVQPRKRLELHFAAATSACVHSEVQHLCRLTSEQQTLFRPPPHAERRGEQAHAPRHRWPAPAPRAGELPVREAQHVAAADC